MNQLFMEAQIEGMEDTDSSNMALVTVGEEIGGYGLETRNSGFQWLLWLEGGRDRRVG